MTGSAVPGFAALMEISIAMVLLSWFLPYRANRWARVVAGSESLEIACTLLIVWHAWTWRLPAGAR